MAERFAINMQPILEQEAKKLVSTYRKLLTKKQGIKKDPAPHNKPATIARKGKDHWLVDTGETKNKGFLFRAGSNYIIVTASNALHSGKYTYMGVPEGHIGQKKGVHRPHTQKRIMQGKKRIPYKRIFSYHNKQGYSGIFQKWPVGSNAIHRIITYYKKELAVVMSEEYNKIKIKNA